MTVWRGFELEKLSQNAGHDIGISRLESLNKNLLKINM